MKIRKKLVLYYVGIALFALICVMVDSFYNVDKEIVSNAKNNLGAIAEIQKARVNQFADEEMTLLHQITGRTGIIDNLAGYNQNHDATNLAQLLTRLNDAKTSVPDFDHVAALDMTGKIVASTASVADTEAHYRLADVVKEIDQENIRAGLNESVDPKVVFHGPVMKGGKQIGAILIVASNKDIATIMGNYTGLGTTGETAIATRDANGDALFLVDTRFSNGQQSLRVSADKKDVAIIKALSKEEGLFTNLVDYRGSAVYAVTRYLPELDMGLVVKIDKAELYKPIFSYATQIGLIGLIVLILAIIAAWLAARSISEPIEQLQHGADLIAQGDYTHDVSTDLEDEVGDLSRSFGKMMKAIITSRAEVDSQVREQTKEIVENAKDMRDQQRAVINILEDVEVEKEKAKSAKTRLDFATKSAAIGIWDWDIVKNTIVWDDKMFELYGIKREADTVAYDVWQKGLHPDDMKVTVKLLNDAVAGKAEYDTKFRVIWPDKSEHNIRAFGMLIKDNNGKPSHMIGVNFDITKDFLVDKAKTEFVSLASHQLRTPLSAINWYAEMLTNGDAGKLTKEQEQYVAEIYKGNQRMVDLVNSLLNVSRIELGTFMIDPVPTDIVDMAKDVVKESTPLIAEKKLKVNQEYEAGIPKLNIDPKLTRIIIQNLLSNAIKYTEKGEVTLSMKKEKDDLLLKVADTGLGIPKGQHDKIFQKLFRADNVRESDTEGTGLGLYLVKSILDHTGGTIRFESVEKKGTTFYVTIPLSGMQKKEGTKTIE